MEIIVKMDGHDFEHLFTNSMQWDQGWSDHVESGRFEHMQKAHDEKPSYAWAYAYWLGDDWSHVMLCRSFLEANDYGYEILWDLAEPGEFLLLTHFKSPCWVRSSEREAKHDAEQAAFREEIENFKGDVPPES